MLLVRQRFLWIHSVSHMNLMFALTNIQKRLLITDSSTHVKESFFTDVFGSPHSRSSDHHRLHLRQIDVAPAIRVLPGVVVPQL